MSSRAADVRGERVVGLFLDRYFYPKITNKYKKSSRVYDKERQVQGSDIILTETSTGKEVCIDEKAHVRSMGKTENLVTFLEIQAGIEEVEESAESSEDNKGNMETAPKTIVKEGWFVKDNDTELYIFIWITKTRKKENNQEVELNKLVVDDVEELELVFVPKDKILSWLSEELGVDESEIIDELKKQAQELRDGNEVHLGIEGCEIFKSSREEKPINLRVTKEKITELSIEKYICNTKEVK